MSVLHKAWELLTPQGRRELILVVGFNFLTSILEVLSISSVLPFMAVAGSPTVMQQSSKLAKLSSLMGVHDHTTLVYVLGGATVLLLFSANMCSALNTYLTYRFSSREQSALSCRLLSKYLHKDYQWYVNTTSAKLFSRVMGETVMVVAGAILPAVRLTGRLFVISFIVAGLLILHPVIALTTAAVLCTAYGLIYAGLRARMANFGALRTREEHQRAKVAREALDGFKAAAILGRPEFFVNRYETHTLRASRLNATHTVIGELPRYVFESLAFGGVIGVILFLLASVGDIRQVLPTLSVFTLAAYRLLPALQQSFLYVTTIRYNTPLLEDIYREFTDASGEWVPSHRVEQIPFEQQIELQEVSYQYPGTSEPVLRGLNLRIPKNSSAAFVGSTGAGKTTLVDLILGLLRPQGGAILIDQVELTPQNISAWQKHIGYVPQDIYILDATLRENIAFGRPRGEIDDEAVVRAASVARIHEFILSLPRGYETTVGERGVRLSGGQRQRLGIARALYHNPSVLVFDEATSALDNETEEAVMEAINGLAGQKTILMIAHRLTTVIRCDTIFVLKAGEVEAAGTYAELSLRSPTFQSLARAHPTS